MKTCAHCGQPVKYVNGVLYKFDEVCFVDGLFVNDLPNKLATIVFSDGAKLLGNISRVNEKFVTGLLGVEKIKPIGFLLGSSK